jgi:hypothetical protein
VEVTWGEAVSALTASRDLRAIVNAGLFKPIGDTRGRYYVGTDPLKAEWQRIRNKWPRRPEADDPFDVASRRLQLSLDLATT